MILHTDRIDQIQIETKFACNLRCSFCPNSLREPTGHEMPEELFTKILDDMEAIDFRGRITLYLRNEPLLDKRIFDFIGEARSRFPLNRINTSTNGELLNDENGSEMFNRGLTDLDISCYSDRTWNKWGCNPSMSINPVDVRTTREWIYNRGGYVDYGRKECGIGFCGRPFIQMYITSEGKCVLCCSDFFEDVVLGDLNNQTIKQVWEGEPYQEYREKMKTNRRKELKLCSTCNYEGW